MNKLMTPEIIKQRSIENRIKKEIENTRRKKEKIEKMISSCEDKFISKICELFINRWDCYAIQDNTNPLLFPTIYQELTIDIIKNSLTPNSDITIGIHQINEDKVKWLCYDIDKKHTPITTNPKLLSDQIIKYLNQWYNLQGYLEPSGSPDSYHIWIFTEPTDVDTAINFHKTFKNRLKYIGIDTKTIEKGISKGDKGLGCMIKLPFNIQRKTNKQSELIADILTINQERLPDIQIPINQISQQSELYNTPKYGGVACVLNVTKRTEQGKFEDNFEHNFEDMLVCENIISLIPLDKLKLLEEEDRSGLDFVIVKALAEANISKGVIYKYLKTIPRSKIHVKEDNYFQRTYSRVLESIVNDDGKWSRKFKYNRMAWHTAWQENALRLGMKIEVKLHPSYNFRADIYDPKRRIVTEIQYKNDLKNVKNRYSFYQSMDIKIRWIFDYREKYDIGNFKLYRGTTAKCCRTDDFVFFSETCPPNIQCLFDELGTSICEIYFNIEYNFIDNTHTLLKIEKRYENGNGYGKIISSIHKEPFNIPSIKSVLDGKRFLVINKGYCDYVI